MASKMREITEKRPPKSAKNSLHKKWPPKGVKKQKTGLQKARKMASTKMASKRREKKQASKKGVTKTCLMPNE